MFGANLKRYRERTGISQKNLAEKLYVSQQTVAKWELDKSTPNPDTIVSIAELLHVSTDNLLGINNLQPVSLAKDTIKIPVLGKIPAGIPMEAIEDIIDYIEIPDDWTIGDKEYFALKINGDSMSPEYLSGDVVIFRKCETCNNGDDCAVMVNGDDATFKRIERKENGIILKPLNAAYEISFFTNKDIESKPVRILGIAVELRRKK